MGGEVRSEVSSAPKPTTRTAAKRKFSETGSILAADVGEVPIFFFFCGAR
jgi:hypothetical protein